VTVYYYLGKTYLEHKKDSNNALLYLKKGLKIAPNGPSAKKITNLIRMLEKATKKTNDF